MPTSASRDRAVNAQHVYLHLDPRGVFAVDLLTRTGTRLRRHGPRRPGWLAPGEWIEVAGRRIEPVRIRIDGPGRRPAQPCDDDLLAELRAPRTALGPTLEPASAAAWTVLGARLGAGLPGLVRRPCGIQSSGTRRSPRSIVRRGPHRRRRVSWSTSAVATPGSTTACARPRSSGTATPSAFDRQRAVVTVRVRPESEPRHGSRPTRTSPPNRHPAGGPGHRPPRHRTRRPDDVATRSTSAPGRPAAGPHGLDGGDAPADPGGRPAAAGRDAGQPGGSGSARSSKTTPALLNVHLRADREDRSRTSPDLRAEPAQRGPDGHPRLSSPSPAPPSPRCGSTPKSPGRPPRDSRLDHLAPPSRVNQLEDENRSAWKDPAPGSRVAALLPTSLSSRPGDDRRVARRP